MKNIALFLLICACLSFAGQRPMTVDDLWAMKRIGETVLSPDGRWLAYVQTVYEMDKNSGNADLWMVPAAGGEPKALTFSPKYDGVPRWKPDGSGLGFISARDGSRQIYFLPLDGGEARKLTSFPVDVEDFIWSADGRNLLFTATVFADADNLQQTADRLEAQEKSKVKVHIADHLFYRAFDHWTGNMRTHLFIHPLEGGVIDLTPGDYDTPPLDLGGSRDFDVSPENDDVAFVRNFDAVPAASTNNDVCIVPLFGGPLIGVSIGNAAVDNQPSFSPDRQYLVYRTMRRPGFEADQYDLMLYDRQTGQKVNLTTQFDLSVDEAVWSPDSRFIYLTAAHQGRSCIFVLDVARRKVDELLHEHCNSNLMVSPDGRTLYFKQQSVQSPDDLYRMDLGSKQVLRLTQVNQSLLSQLAINPAEDFWFTSFDGKKAHGLLLKPPAFDPTKKYPFIYVIHGGPQGASQDDFHFRWNPSLFAAPGYVVAMVNFRGSSGYGQEWTDAVSKDWGGGPYQDLMAGIDYLVKTYPFIDEKRMAAAGGSYGGFMVNWIATHTGRFKALVTHAGVFDQRSMYGATEELWFPEWEFGGIPYEKPELFEKWSVTNYVANLKKFRTPMLVIHGEGDYRVPYTQGMQMFTALQRMGVPSRLILFEDETHFVLKPQDARLWWTEVLGWIGRWTK